MENSTIHNMTITYALFQKKPTFPKDLCLDSLLMSSELSLTHLPGNLRQASEYNPDRAVPLFQLNDRPSRQESHMKYPIVSFSESMREAHIKHFVHSHK